MKIGIIGAGNVGATLGKTWHGAGHEILYGVRNPADPKYAVLQRNRSSVVSVPEAAAAEIIVLSTPWPATRQAIDAAGGLGGKIVLDATNPLKGDLSGLETGPTESAGECVQKWAPAARVVKAFNTVGAPNMTPEARFPVKPVMFICGNDAAAKDVVLKLVAEAGFAGTDAGGIEASRMLENLALLWVHLAYRQRMGTDFAWALVRQEK